MSQWGKATGLAQDRCLLTVWDSCDRQPWIELLRAGMPGLVMETEGGCCPTGCSKVPQPWTKGMSEHPPPRYHIMVPQATIRNTQTSTRGPPQQVPQAAQRCHSHGQRERHKTHHLSTTSWSHKQLGGIHRHGQGDLRNTYHSCSPSSSYRHTCGPRESQTTQCNCIPVQVPPATQICPQPWIMETSKHPRYLYPILILHQARRCQKPWTTGMLHLHNTHHIRTPSSTHREPKGILPSVITEETCHKLRRILEDLTRNIYRALQSSNYVP
nr:uncharacterized protein LOC110363486 [Columba livia]